MGPSTPLDQVPELTFYQGGAANPSEFVMWPLGGTNQSVPFSYNISHYKPGFSTLPGYEAFLTPMEADDQIRREATQRGRMFGSNVVGTRCLTDDTFGSRLYGQ